MFTYKEGKEGLLTSLKDQAEKKSSLVDNPLPILIADKNNPFSIGIVGENGRAIDILGTREKYESSFVDKIQGIVKKYIIQKIKKPGFTSSKGINAKINYPFVNYSQLKKFVKNRYGKKMYSGYKEEYLKTFNQGNVKENTGNKYACEVVAATFALSMQGRIYNNTWYTYNEIYNNANVVDGGTNDDDVKKSLNIYYKKHYKSNGFKAYYDDTKVRFADVKKCVDNNYKSILSLYANNSGHSVPVLGYYSYFFTNEYAVDYVIISTDWYDDCEMYFDSVYLNEGEMDSEADLTYMKPYVYQ